MKLILPLTILLVLASCTSTEAQKTTPKNPKKGAVSDIGPPNGESPITVADGASLHVQNNNIRVVDQKTAYVDLGYKAVSFEVDGCPALVGCASSPSTQSLLNVKWTLTANDGTSLKMDPSSGKPTRIDIRFSSQAKTDRMGLYEDSVHLTSATLSINNSPAISYHCPTSPPTDKNGNNFCTMVIRYCQNGDCS